MPTAGLSLDVIHPRIIRYGDGVVYRDFGRGKKSSFSAKNLVRELPTAGVRVVPTAGAA